MKSILCAFLLFVGINTTIASDEYFDFQSEPIPSDISPIDQIELIEEPIDEQIKPTEDIPPQDYKEIEDWRDIFAVLFGGTGLTLSGILAYIFRVWYQSHKGQLVVKHVKVNLDDITDDIIENIARLTDIDTGEEARMRLKHIQDELLKIAKTKLKTVTNK